MRIAPFLALVIILLFAAAFYVGRRYERSLSSTSRRYEEIQATSNTTHAVLTKVERLADETLAFDPDNPLAVQVTDEIRRFKTSQP